MTTRHRSLKHRVHALLTDWRERGQMALAKARMLRAGSRGDLTRADWAGSLTDPTAFYGRCYRYFHFQLPPAIRSHREYFKTNKRGFGEDAFHALWFLLVREFQPRNFVEIGVYRGQTLSLVALLQKEAGIPCDVTGISPFLPANDSVSIYMSGIDYLEDTRSHFAHFGLAQPSLVKAFSTAPEAVAHLASRKWDLVYIDGNHDYEVAKADWEHCTANLAPGGVVVLDDSALHTSFTPPPFATKGHPGPSQLANEIDRTQFREILQVGHNRVFQKL